MPGSRRDAASATARTSKAIRRKAVATRHEAETKEGRSALEEGRAGGHNPLAAGAPKTPGKMPAAPPKAKQRFSEDGAPPSFTMAFKSRCYTCGAEGHSSNDQECPMAGISKDDMTADMRAKYDAVKKQQKDVRTARSAWAKAHY